MTPPSDVIVDDLLMALQNEATLLHQERHPLRWLNTLGFDDFSNFWRISTLVLAFPDSIYTGLGSAAKTDQNRLLQRKKN